VGWTEAPVHVATDLTPAQVKAYRLMDNRSHDEASWDNDLLGTELLDLKGLSAIDLQFTGFGADEIAKLIAPAEDVTTEARASLSERVGVPPFSILDARQGYWQTRKKAWLALGIKSELGRGGNLLKLSDTNDEYMYNKKEFFARKGEGEANGAAGAAHAEARP